jgi:hypothetical protein
MRVQLVKKKDGDAVLKCVRHDGTETWQKQRGRYAAFFPLHDLTHFAVESELGLRDAFYGLIAQGWSLEDTEGKGPRALPAEALFAENIVGTLDRERASGTRWTADEFNYALSLDAAAKERPLPPALTDEQLGRVRQRRAELFARWSELPDGETLELAFHVIPSGSG